MKRYLSLLVVGVLFVSGIALAAPGDALIETLLEPRITTSAERTASLVLFRSLFANTEALGDTVIIRRYGTELWIEGRGVRPIAPARLLDNPDQLRIIGKVNSDGTFTRF